MSRLFVKGLFAGGHYNVPVVKLLVPDGNAVAKLYVLVLKGLACNAKCYICPSTYTM